ncbi:DUF2019 domain-containing protein [Kribbella sp. NBC_01245]|uniref:DUF2019 domain-containing protein n=1 Tax=Kribbella sp. NBC_01245 TaxID=2903578 RepID=UPI002E28829A|nr:DUF2019 domain-containing protein [Kribbella sp. NBC_01245]
MDLNEYEQSAREWDALVGVDAERANVVFDRLHVLAKEMRESADGRAALVGLMAHESAGVRLLAATECLVWDPVRARAVLAAIEDAGGLHGVSAKYTLQSFEAGTLDLDW